MTRDRGMDLLSILRNDVGTERLIILVLTTLVWQKHLPQHLRNLQSDPGWSLLVSFLTLMGCSCRAWHRSCVSWLLSVRQTPNSHSYQAMTLPSFARLAAAPYSDLQLDFPHQVYTKVVLNLNISHWLGVRSSTQCRNNKASISSCAAAHVDLRLTYQCQLCARQLMLNDVSLSMRSLVFRRPTSPLRVVGPSNAYSSWFSLSLNISKLHQKRKGFYESDICSSRWSWRMSTLSNRMSSAGSWHQQGNSRATIGDPSCHLWDWNSGLALAT